MFVTILVGFVLVFITTMIHAIAMIVLVKWLRATHVNRWADASHLARGMGISSLVLLMLAASLIEAGIWAFAYIGLGAINGVEEALYFSTVTYTSLGYGDVVLTGHWRLLASIEAATGMIMFGWTTALIVAAVRRVYLSHGGTGSQGGRADESD